MPGILEQMHFLCRKMIHFYIVRGKLLATCPALSQNYALVWNLCSCELRNLCQKNMTLTTRPDSNYIGSYAHLWLDFGLMFSYLVNTHCPYIGWGANNSPVWSKFCIQVLHINLIYYRNTFTYRLCSKNFENLKFFLYKDFWGWGKPLFWKCP